MVVHLYRNEWEELQRAIWQLQGSSSNILNKRANQQFVKSVGSHRNLRLILRTVYAYWQDQPDIYAFLTLFERKKLHFSDS